MLLTQTLTRLGEKNMDEKELLKDLDAFSSITGEDGDRIIEHLAVKFKIFDTNDSKPSFKAGFDEGARAVITYLAYARNDLDQLKKKVDDERRKRN